MGTFALYPYIFYYMDKIKKGGFVYHGKRINK